MNVLPRVDTERTYRKLFAEDRVWGPALRTICARHGLDASQLVRADLGSHIVYFCGELVLKLFCPIWPESASAERAVLRAGVEGAPLPELVFEGELEGWPYVAMTRVRGVAALRVWNDLDTASRVGVVEQIAALMRALHATPPVADLALDWEGFLAERVARIDTHHAGGGAEWLRAIHARVDDFAPPPFDPVLLSADITEDHVLLSEESGRWTVTGFIDFGDAMMGDPHYEFIAPLAFFTNGEPELSRALVQAYGWTLDDVLADRLTTYCFLHRFGRLQELVGRSPADDMEEFQLGLWGGL